MPTFTTRDCKRFLRKPQVTLFISPFSIKTRAAESFFLILLSFGWVAASALALWQFIKAQPAIAYAYASPIVPGWGAWATLGGSLLMSIVLSLGVER